MTNTPRAVRVAALAALACACAGPARDAPPAVTNGASTPVLLELFTSEGCSSCPPADDVLRKLLAEQPIPGVEIVALSEHVDYWNRLGWTDPFSSSTVTARQRTYQAEVFSSSAIYTPQVVIDGSLECIGSNMGAVRAAVNRAARAPKVEVHLTADATPAGRQIIVIDVVAPSTVQRRGLADVVVAVVEDGLRTDVARGENSGRVLLHDAVVRVMTTAGQLSRNDDEGSFRSTITLQGRWRRDRLRLVTFVQERESRKILGIASAPLAN